MTIRHGVQPVRVCRRLQAGVLSWGLTCGLALAAVASAASAAADAPPLGGTWQPIGPSGGQISALAVDPHHPATIYAGTYGGGLYRSDDFGQSWSARGLSSWVAVYSVTIDPVVSDTVYAGVDGTQVNGALWKSLDGGSSWQAVGAELPYLFLGEGVTSLVIDPLTRSTLYAETDSALWKSVDGARSWAALPVPYDGFFGYPNALAIDPHTPAILYAGGDSGLFKSRDGGATWASIARFRHRIVTSVVVDPVLPRRIYAGILQEYGSKLPALFVSTDRGGTWRPADSGLAPRAPANGLGAQSIWSLAVSPAAHLSVYAGTYDGVWKSTDGGSSWAPANGGLSGVLVGILAADPRTSGRLYAGLGILPSNAAVGVWKTPNGGAAWRFASSGIDASDVGTLVVDPSGTGMLYAAVPGAGVLRRQGGDWQPANQGLVGAQVSALAIDPQQPLTLYAETEAGFWKTVDGAAHWSQPSPGTTVFAPPLLIDPQTPTTLYAMGDPAVPGISSGFQNSVDGGVTWKFLPVGGFSFDPAIAPSAPRNLYWLSPVTIVILPPFKTQTVDYLSHSPDGGLSVDTKTTWGVGSLGPLAVDPQDPATVYVATVVTTATADSHGLLRSTDSGGSFALLPLDCGPGCVALVFAPGPPQTLYAAAGDTIVASTDGGGSWTPVGDPLPAGAGITSMTFDPSSQTLFLATRNRGVYQLMP
ncbi:MAG TPA: hypothetical protein VN999_05045 [Thermoanaerobaculia bacterium]|nr:hypothetical protein [Thermoanaerobaculia bacterium]